MALPFNLSSGYKLVGATAGAVTTDGGITCDYISMKTAHKVWIVGIFDQAVADATGIDPTQATTVAGGSVKAITNVCNIWANEDMAASDTLVKQTSAITYNLTADVKTKMVVIEIDPSSFDVSGGFDCLGCTVDASGEGTDFCTLMYIVQTRYPQATPPAAITN